MEEMQKVLEYRARLLKKLGPDRWSSYRMQRSELRDALELSIELLGELEAKVDDLLLRLGTVEDR